MQEARTAEELRTDFGLADEESGYEGAYRREGESHVLEFSTLGVSLTASRVSIAKEELRCRLEVRSNWPGGPAQLWLGPANLSGPRARRDLQTHLTERAPITVDWGEVLQQLYARVDGALQDGSVTVRLADVQPRMGSKFRVEPISFEKLPVIWFGRGGSGKSLLAAAVTVGMAANTDIVGLPLLAGPPLFCDWETDAETFREQVALICAGHGLSVPRDIHYRKCLSPLVQEAEGIGRYISREGICMVFGDSLGMAAGGDKNEQWVATGIFGAIRLWDVAFVGIDHIAKGESTNTPYGSVYFENAARATWRARGSMKGNEQYLVLEMEKTNLGRFETVCWRFRFLPDAKLPEAIAVERIDEQDVPGEIGAGQDCRVAIREALIEQRQALTVTDLVEMIGHHEKTVRNKLAEMVKDGELVKVIIRGAASKYALKTARGEE